MYPPPDPEPWPTLGPDVCEFIEANLVHGPGDLFGHPVELNDELRAWIFKLYEIEPPYIFHRKGRGRTRTPNPRAGKRRFERCALSLRKGSAKTEIAAWVAAAELHPDGPVRCAGFKTIRGMPNQPIPRGVTDPYIPMIAYTEEQSEELAYGALRRILEESTIASDFDIGLQRIVRLRGDGKAEAVSATPNARDGARTTFQHADETHRFTLDHLKRAWTVMLANMGKRPLADPWALETTTAPEPGGGSVAESTMSFAQRADAKRDYASRLFFFHREASASHNLETDAGLKAAILEASGPYIAAWSDPERIMRRFRDADADPAYVERVWLNRCVQATAKAFDVPRWKSLARPGYVAPKGAPITLGFDGSRYEDTTALIGTELETGHQWVLGCWEKPATAADGWGVVVEEVTGVVSDAFERWKVVRMYCDPPKWESWIARWAGKYGDKRVVEWWTNRRKPMAYALKSYVSAMEAEELSHDADPRFTAHIGNACRLYTNLVDESEEQKPLWILRKERPDSPNKIDLGVAGALSWEARTDAITAGEGQRRLAWVL
jgi:hypothetical protein